MSTTDQHIYNRIAAALNHTYSELGLHEKVTYEEVETACEKLHEKGLNVTTYANAGTVALVLRALALVA